MVEVYSDDNKVRGPGWGSALSESQQVKGEKEIRWEKSSLAKFNHFFGFLTDGLEKEIMNFLIKIRKIREMIHNKILLEESKFERGLKRLECSINYEGGSKQKCPL